MADQTGRLFLVPTPLGNLGDITMRAADVLRSCAHVVAEDTRRTIKLLSHLGADASRLSRLDANAMQADLDRVARWLEAGRDVALVTDAGTPCISDPGVAVVRLAIARGARVESLPGPSAVTAAVALSGLVEGPFYFAGFLPRGKGELAAAVAQLASRTEPVVLFEAPHRITDALQAMAEAMPDRQVVVAREMTKLHEEILRGTLAEIAAVQREWLGEITVVLGPWTRMANEAPDDDAVDARIDEELAKGTHTRTVAERVAAWSGRPKRDVYARVIERKGERT